MRCTGNQAIQPLDWIVCRARLRVSANASSPAGWYVIVVATFADTTWWSWSKRGRLKFSPQPFSDILSLLRIEADPIRNTNNYCPEMVMSYCGCWSRGAIYKYDLRSDLSKVGEYGIRSYPACLRVDA